MMNLRSQMTEETIRELAFNLLKAMFDTTPFETKKTWGMKVYSRFITQVWKAFETNQDLQAAISCYFRLIHQSQVPQEVISAFDAIPINTENEKYAFKSLLLAEKELLVGRIQYSRPGKQQKSTLDTAPVDNQNSLFAEELINA